MIHSSADPRVLGYLGRALSLELSAVQLYSTQAQLVTNWGLAEPAARLREEASEELEHAQRLIARMLSLGVAPNASQLRPVQLGTRLEDLLQQDQAFEAELVQLYEAAARYCAQVGDHDNRLFFEGLFEEERRHGAALAEWLQALRQPVWGAGAAGDVLSEMPMPSGWKERQRPPCLQRRSEFAD